MIFSDDGGDDDDDDDDDDIEDADDPDGRLVSAKCDVLMPIAGFTQLTCRIIVLLQPYYSRSAAGLQACCFSVADGGYR